MMFKKSIFILLAGVAMAGCTAASSFRDRAVMTIFINEQPLEVEVVTTVESTAQGLSGRDEIGHDGMLFVFEETRTRNFWMKEMKFALDMVWIHNGVVVGIAQDVPPPDQNATFSELPLYSSNQPVDMVLELPAGDAAAKEIIVGSVVEFK